MKYTITMLLAFSAYANAPKVEEGVFVFDSNKDLISIIKNHKDLVIDHPSEAGYEVYGPKGVAKWLEKDLKANISSLENNTKELERNGYPSSKKIGEQLKKLAAENPNIFKLTSIGRSHKGQPLWLMKISDNPNIDELEPEVKYIANIHGDEIVGREMMVRFIRDIAKRYKKGERVITDLVDNTEVFIIPSMNPDGADKRRRGNAKNRDLNRDFPDFTTRDNQNRISGRQPETIAVMNFQKNRNFALSANFHGGAICVNYPWDTSGGKFPLEDLIVDLSLDYASLVPDMRNSSRFTNGITNGYEWYEVNGGMQDWSYNWHDDLQVTIELSNTKWPNYDTNDQYYEDNKASLVNYLSRVHQGAGFKLPSGISKASVEIKDHRGKSIGTYSTSTGEFYKVLSPGDYSFKIKGKNYTKKLNLKVQKKLLSRGENYITL